MQHFSILFYCPKMQNDKTSEQIQWKCLFWSLPWSGFETKIEIELSAEKRNGYQVKIKTLGVSFPHNWWYQTIDSYCENYNFRASKEHYMENENEVDIKYLHYQYLHISILSLLLFFVRSLYRSFHTSHRQSLNTKWTYGQKALVYLNLEANCKIRMKQHTHNTWKITTGQKWRCFLKMQSTTKCRPKTVAK